MFLFHLMLKCVEDFDDGSVSIPRNLMNLRDFTLFLITSLAEVFLVDTILHNCGKNYLNDVNKARIYQRQERHTKRRLMLA